MAKEHKEIATKLMAKYPDLSIIKKKDFTKEKFMQMFPHNPIPLDQKFYDLDASHKNDRHQAAHLLYTSEEAYIHKLLVSLFVFRNPILEAWENHDLPKYLHIVIELFDALEKILGFNLLLLATLQDRFKNWSDEQTVGDIFCAICPYAAVYIKYVPIYSEANSAIRKAVEKDKEFASVLKTAEEHELVNKLKLDAYLIQPIQRYPRYIIMLQDLLHQTPQTHPDHVLLSNALEQAKSMGSRMDTALVEEEKKEKVLELMAAFGDLPIPHFRQFVHEGVIIKQCRKFRKPRVVVLFSDAVLYGHSIPHSDKYKFAGEIPLDHCTVEDIPDNDELDVYNSFAIKGPGKSFQAYAETPEDKITWLKHFSEQIPLAKVASGAQALKDKDEAPVWVPDIAAEECAICKHAFKVFKRKHHCRKCGLVVCADCSKHSIMVLAVDKDDTVRVCNNCYRASVDS